MKNKFFKFKLVLFALGSLAASSSILSACSQAVNDTEKDNSQLAQQIANEVHNASFENPNNITTRTFKFNLESHDEKTISRLTLKNRNDQKIIIPQSLSVRYSVKINDDNNSVVLTVYFKNGTTSEVSTKEIIITGFQNDKANNTDQPVSLSNDIDQVFKNISQINFKNIDGLTLNEFKLRSKELVKNINNFELLNLSGQISKLPQGISVSYSDISFDTNNKVMITVTLSKSFADFKSQSFLLISAFKEEIQNTPHSYRIQPGLIEWNSSVLFDDLQTLSSVKTWTLTDLKKYVKFVPLLLQNGSTTIKEVPSGIRIVSEGKLIFDFANPNISIVEPVDLNALNFPKTNEYAKYVLDNKLNIDQTEFQKFYPSALQSKIALRQNEGAAEGQNITFGLSLTDQKYSAYDGFNLIPVVETMEILSANSAKLTLSLFNRDYEANQAIGKLEYYGKREIEIDNMLTPNPKNFDIFVLPKRSIYQGLKSNLNDLNKQKQILDNFLRRRINFQIIDSATSLIEEQLIDSHKGVNFIWIKGENFSNQINLSRPISLDENSSNFIPKFSAFYHDVISVSQKQNEGGMPFEVNVRISLDFNDGQPAHDFTLTLRIRDSVSS
ncbi:hypothetical protein [[Mycoplasma] testudinis]|uniref:hypothetical protein n=1 Tax=[Mycoplasma] testudinis TaxID=33924 RepID=UPI000480FE06|nr:hypothetical protein [[Mycoplasma] testudinis]